MRRSLFAIATLAMSAGVASAQSDATPAAREPLVNASLATGILLVQIVEDGRSLARWDFDLARQYRGSLDRRIAANTTLGVTFGYAAMPLTYSRMRSDPDASPTCFNACSATADLWSLGAAFRVVSGTGLYHLLELNAEVNQFSNFREEESGAQLAPFDGDRDIAFTGGYGFGWAPGRRFQLSAVMNVGFVLHAQAGPFADNTQIAYLTALRLVVRSGFSP